MTEKRSVLKLSGPHVPASPEGTKDELYFMVHATTNLLDPLPGDTVYWAEFAEFVDREDIDVEVIYVEPT